MNSSALSRLKCPSFLGRYVPPCSRGILDRVTHPKRISFRSYIHKFDNNWDRFIIIIINFLWPGDISYSTKITIYLRLSNITLLYKFSLGRAQFINYPCATHNTGAMQSQMRCTYPTINSTDSACNLPNVR